jgi:hypothetical protein
MPSGYIGESSGSCGQECNCQESYCCSRH